MFLVFYSCLETEDKDAVGMHEPTDYCLARKVISLGHFIGNTQVSGLSLFLELISTVSRKLPKYGGSITGED